MDVPELGDLEWFDISGLKKGKKEDNNTPYKQWQKNQDGDTYFPDIKPIVCKTMEPGLYEVFYTRDAGYFARKVVINHDNLVEIREKEVKNVIVEVQEFWNKKEAFKEAKVFYKRGILLHGTPGQGKTSVIDLICENLTKIEGIAFRVNTIDDLKNTYEFLKSAFKKIQPDTPFMIIVEDIDKFLKQEESYVSNILDGKDSVEGQLIVATTNRLQDLSDIILRPSRFDQLVAIEMPSSEDKLKYLQSFKMEENEIEDFLKVSNDFTMAQIKELFVGVKLLGNELEEMSDRISNNKKKCKSFSGTYTGKTAGFK